MLNRNNWLLTIPIAILHGMALMIFGAIGLAYLTIGGETGDWFFFAIALFPALLIIHLSRHLYKYRKEIYVHHRKMKKENQV